MGGRRCSVCDHAERAAIESAIAAGAASNRRIATQFGVSEAALRRHRASHLRPLEGFVGRQHELDALESGLAAASAGRGRLYLVVGEPGIGKSRLLDELAAKAVRRGCVVLWGRCWEAGGAPALWPWRQILRAWSREGAFRPGPHSDLLLRLVPELGQEVEDAATDGDASRFRLFSSMVDVLRDAASEVPLALLLDDIHAADRDSLHLLQLVARELHSASVLIAATYRDIEARRSPDLARALADVAREGHRLPLGGLAEAEVARMIENVAGARPEPRIVRAVHEATEGNPFFVDEIARLHASKPTSDGNVTTLEIPDGVREAIRATLVPVDPDVRSLLDTAAVAGREFDASVVGTVGDIDPDVVRDRLLSSGVVIDASGRLSFSHALVRETIYDDLTPGTRVLLHRRVGEALEARPGTGPTELARHFFAAAQAGCAEKALEYSALAGDEASEVFAYEEAADHYVRALQALGLTDPDDRRRCDLLIALGLARWGAGEVARSNESLKEAIEVARRLEDARRFAGAVRSMAAETPFGEPDTAWLRLIDEALAALGPDDSADRAALLARRAVLRAFDDRAGSIATAREAVSMARRVGDDSVLGTALVFWLRTSWGPDTVAQRLETADELLALKGGSAVDRLRALEARTSAYLELGDRRAANAALRELGRLADRMMVPAYRWLAMVLETGMTILDGRLDDAERRAEEALTIGTQAQDAASLVTYGGQLVLIRREQGRLSELEETIVSSVDRYASIWAWRAALALLYAESGRTQRATAELERVPFTSLPHDAAWPLTAAVLAEAFAALRDDVRAAGLYEQLLPYAGRVVVVGNGLACYAPVDRLLGLLASARRRWEDAERHLADALAVSRRMGAPAWQAHVLADQARVLLARGAGDDRTHAVRLLADARTIYAELGLDRRRQIVAAEVEAIQASPEAVVRGAPERATLRVDGASWVMDYEGSTMRVRDALGMRYLAYLLVRPGSELHVLDLVSAAAGRKVAHGDAGDVLDPAARAAYRARVAELRADLDEAEEGGDADRVARIQDEIDAIAHELSAGLGLGGRSRKAAAEAERARLNVRRAIRTAMRSIEELNPSLGRYLETTIRTGVFCSYTPDPRFPVIWEA